MKKKLLMAMALASMLAAGTISAQTGQEMMQDPDPGAMASSPQAMQPMGYGRGPCKMRDGMGMGPGMMDGGMGMGPGMMGGGMGMGPGMMHRGMGMGPGMMHRGMGLGCGMKDSMLGNLDPEDQQKYLDATKQLRKKLNDKQFEYSEAARNAKTSKADLVKMRKELWEMQHEIQEKAWGFMKE